MKVLFIYYNNTEESFMPVSLSLLGGMLRDHNIESRIFDTSWWKDTTYELHTTDREIREKFGGYKKVPGYDPIKVPVSVPEKFEEVVDEYRPDLIAISSTSHEYYAIAKFVAPVKKKYKIPVIAGGSHATVAPERAIVADGVDMICIGEGEDALVEVVQTLEMGGTPSGIPSIWYKFPDGTIRKNPVRPQAKPMDELPEPNWDIIDPRHRVRPFEGEIKQYGFFETSRGCPFDCSYCINATLHKIRGINSTKPAGFYRFHSATEIIRRLKKFKNKYGFNHLQFIDENMPTMPVSKLEEFANLYARDVNVQFFMQSRPEYFVKNPEKAKILAGIGCKMIAMGAEVGNEEFCTTVLNRPMKAGTVEKASEILKDAGIMVAAYYMIGFPGETKELIEETIAMHKRIAPHRHSVRFLHPYPGTPIRKICVDNGWFPDDFEETTEPQSYFVEPRIELPSPPHPTKQELIDLRQKFSEVYTYKG